MNKLISIATIAAVTTVSGACTRSAEADMAGQQDVKRLVLYYSQTGTTKAVAEALQHELGADIEAIEVDIPYAGTYEETIARVMDERSRGVVPKVKPLAHNPQDYDVVFLGYPIWFGSYAPPIAALIESQDFNDTKVVPFCTFGSGGLEASTDSLRQHLPAAEIADGYGIRTARIDSLSGELHRFLINNGHILGECQQLDDFSIQRPVTAEEAALFDKATGDYMFPLGTAVTCGHRDGYDGTEYMFVAKGVTPAGDESYSTVLVNVPLNGAGEPVFTRVVR